VNRPLLAKLTRPEPALVLPRPRLFEGLDEELPLVWVSGPAGAGKTTLVSSYVVNKKNPCLWYQIDAGDADLATFFHYLGLAVQQIAPRHRKALPNLMPEYLPGLLTFTQRFFEQLYLRLSPPAVLVFDNYQEVPAESPLHEVLRTACEVLPSGVRIIVLSRTKPPAPLARLRAYREMKCLDWAELRLTRDEVAAMIALRNPRVLAELQPARIEQLHQHAQGWAAGLVLLLEQDRIARSNTSLLSTATQEVLFDYFAGEVFDRASQEAQTVLLKTALMPQMTALMAGQLTGDPQAKNLLSELHRRNYFITRHEDREPIYEYHPLFRQFLLIRAAQTLIPAELAQLRQQAAALLEKAGRLEEAVGLHREAREWADLARLILTQAQTLLSQGRHQTLLQWLSWLPDGAIARNGWLLYWQGMARLPFAPVEARGHLEQAYAHFQAEDDITGLYSAWAGIMDTFFFEWRDLKPADRWITELEGLRVRYPAFPSRAVELRTYWAMGTLLHRQPQHPFLPTWAERALVMLDAAHDRELSILLGGYVIIYFLWRGDMIKAGGIIERLDPWAHSSDISPLVCILWLCAVALYHSVQGEIEACLKSVKEGLEIAQNTSLHRWDFLLSAQAARCSLVIGDLESAEIWITRMANTMHGHSHINGGFYQHLRANAAAQRGDWQQAVEHARTGLAMAIEAGVPFLEGHCRIDLARALLGSGDAVEWPGHLQIAYTIGQGMDSKVLQYLCLETGARAAFERGEEEAGRTWLAQALALSRKMDEATWLMAGPQISAQLYDRALAAGIEVDHAQRLIRRRRLTPPDPATAPDHWPWPVRIYTLGRFAILCDDEPLRSSRKVQHKPLELIKILCAFGGHSIHQDRVTDALWPDAAGDAADQVLSTTLHRLRKLLQHEQVVRMEDRHISLDPRYIWVDCLVFDRQAHHPNLINRNALQRTISHYRGHFLDGEMAPWVLAFRERLRTHFMKLSERLGDLLEQESDWPSAIDCYHRVVEIEPVAENFYRRLMACHAKLGQRAEALTAFQRCRQALLTYLGVSPTRETQALYQKLIDS
jgi:LuxR family maltose regulon positive regulatory protein